jgi:folate-binding protein YgfZ
MIIQPMTFQLEGLARLTHLGVIRASGADAAAFLHGQLTQDFLLLGTQEARLAAYCSPKGRMLASLIGIKRSADEILLVCPVDMLAATCKRLRMFVLRAKVQLTDASADFSLFGLAGNAAKSIAGEVQPAWVRHDFGQEMVLTLYPTDGVARALILAPATGAAPALEGRIPALEPTLWHWGEVRSGIASIHPATADIFVPQMLNYESVGGVNFKKGCYPGQEVVARSQFRGTLKRRACLAHSEAALNAGDELFEAADSSQPCGLVAQAAPAPGGGYDAIVSLQTAAMTGGAVRLGSAQGNLVQLSAAPYPLLEDI